MTKKLILICSVGFAVVFCGCPSAKELFSNPRLENNKERAKNTASTKETKDKKLGKYQFIYKNEKKELPKELDSKKKELFMDALYFYNGDANGDISNVCNLDFASFESPYDECFVRLIDSVNKGENKDFKKWLSDNNIANVVESLPLKQDASQDSKDYKNNVIKELRAR